MCHESLTWKLFLTSTMLPFTNVSLASFCRGGPPTYRAWTSTRLLMLLIFAQSHEPIYTQRQCVKLSRATNSTKKYFEQTYCSYIGCAQTTGPSFLCRAFLICSLTSWSPFFLPSLHAIHNVRWNPVSPEMAIWRLMVSMKRTLEPLRSKNISCWHNCLTELPLITNLPLTRRIKNSIRTDTGKGIKCQNQTENSTYLH